MQIAVLSDIHGNLEALEAVWADMAIFPVTRIVSLGDMVGYGPNPEEVLQAMRERDVLCCMGNHELGIVSKSERTWFNATARKGLILTEALLSPQSLDYIAKLPRSVVVEGARFVHGFPPDSVTTYLFQVDDQGLVRWFGQGERLTFVGHTHELGLAHWDGAELCRRTMGRTVLQLPQGWSILNAGSVGQPRDGDNHAKYVLWDTLENTIEVRFVSYDIAGTADKILRRGFPPFYAARLW